MLGDWEIPRIESMQAIESRHFVELPVPGRVGSLFQDLNTRPTRIVVSGSVYTDDLRDEFLESLRQKFQAGEPVTFVADILTATEVQYVIIEELDLRESAERPDEMNYLVVLRESPPPPPPPALGGLDTGFLDQAAGLLDTVTGALDLIDGLGSVPDLGDPTRPLTSALDGVTAASGGLDDALGPLREIFGGSD